MKTRRKTAVNILVAFVAAILIIPGVRVWEDPRKGRSIQECGEARQAPAAL